MVCFYFQRDRPTGDCHKVSRKLWMEKNRENHDDWWWKLGNVGVWCRLASQWLSWRKSGQCCHSQPLAALPRCSESGGEAVESASLFQRKAGRPPYPLPLSISKSPLQHFCGLHTTLEHVEQWVRPQGMGKRCPCAPTCLWPTLPFPPGRSRGEPVSP